jgi:hypothetical protein
MSMGLDRIAASSNVIDILDHVLDKGIVVDAWLRVSIGGIDLITVEARMLVASLQTYISYADAVSHIPPMAGTVLAPRPPCEPRSIHEQLRRIQKQLSGARVATDYERRRAEDRVLDELRDSRARTLRAH